MRQSLLACIAVCAGSVLSACASHQVSPENDPAALAALRADVRLVNSDTTWVTRGRGYELVGRTRSDLVAVQPALDRAAAFMAQIYPHDSLAPVVASIRRASAPDKPFVAAAPVPTDTKGTQVELVLVDPKAFEEQRKRSGGPPGGPMPEMPGRAATPVIRAWLSARATRLTGEPAHVDRSRGEAEDPRVPAWAVEMIGTAGNEELIDNSTKSLGAHPETIIPLASYLTMDRPGPMEMPAGGRGGASGDAPPDGRGGGIPGGRGGMGGGRGGMGGGGRGGMGGGPPGGGSPGGRPGGPPGGSRERSFPLQGMALFAAQSAVLTKYFARTDGALPGDLIDAQITQQPIEAVLAKHSLRGLQQVDADWRSWVVERADMLNRR